MKVSFNMDTNQQTQNQAKATEKQADVPGNKSCYRCGGTGQIIKNKRFVRECNLCLSRSQEKKQRISNDSPVVVAIVGAGIGGTALAYLLQKYGFQVVVYERDAHFNERKQGYGLTLQQGSKTLSRIGITGFNDYCTSSTSHYTFLPNGNILSCFGKALYPGYRYLNDFKGSFKDTYPRHIPRQLLRQLLIDSISNSQQIIKWDHKLVDYNLENNKICLSFENGATHRVDMLVGADGIRSAVRAKYLGESDNQLKYLGVIVVLGITTFQHGLLLNRVFQTVDGATRLYVMPFDSSGKTMWQLSWKMDESEGIELCKDISQVKTEILRRCGDWHDPVPALVEATGIDLITAYPVYDRDVLPAEVFCHQQSVTLIGDAAHPMSPFKGQGANQALLDAESLGKYLYSQFKDSFHCDEVNVKLDAAIRKFECEMLNRTRSKVQGSLDKVNFLHSKECILLDKKFGVRVDPYQNTVNQKEGTNSTVQRLRDHQIGAWSGSELDDLVIECMRHENE